MSEPIMFERDGDKCTVMVNRRAVHYDLDGGGYPVEIISDATEDDLRAAGYVRVPSVDRLAAIIAIARTDARVLFVPDMDAYLARAILRALGVQDCARSRRR